jgi:hypothetical protein
LGMLVCETWSSEMPDSRWHESLRE